MTQLQDQFGDIIGVQSPIATDGDSVYNKDVKAALTDNGTFSGSIGSLFNNLDTSITCTAATNPKWFIFRLERPFRVGSVALIAKSGSFSNVKLTYMDRQDTVLTVLDDSTNDTAYTSHKYTTPTPENVYCIKIEFYTANPVTLSFLYIRKQNSVDATLQGLDQNGDRQYVGVTSDNTLMVTNTEYLTAIAEGSIPLHTIFRRFGNTTPSVIGTSLTDVWPVGGSINVPASAAQVKIKTNAATDVAGGVGVNYIYIEGLLADYTKAHEVLATVGTGSSGLSTASVNSYIRINSLRTATRAEATAYKGSAAVGVGTTGAAVGNIDCVDAATGAIPYRRISAGYNVCRCLLYTTAANEHLGIIEFAASSGLGGAAVRAEYVTFSLRAKSLPTGVACEYFYPYVEIGVQNSGNIFNLAAPLWIPEKTDVKVSCVGDSAQSYTGIASIAGWLEPY